MGLNLCVLSEIYESEMWDAQVHVDGSLKCGEGHSIADTSRTDKHDWSSRYIMNHHQFGDMLRIGYIGQPSHNVMAKTFCLCSSH